MDLNWSTETYRLDKVAYKCQLPCVVQVTEGICMDSEAESVSAGDIIKIDKHTRIPKISANFAISKTSEEWESGIPELFDSEIFVPLNYQGKVKIVSELKDYKSLQQLVKDSPRYVTVQRPLPVETEQREKVTVPVGTSVQLDRVIPGIKRGTVVNPDKLVIGFKLDGRSFTVAVPVNRPGHFRSQPDETEYTLKEVVDRYQLPQTVEFLQNDLRKVYIQSLVDVVENVKSFSDTLRLNRVVSQEVLIGHYKPLEELEGLIEPEAEAASHRTLVILPLDAEFVREIEVNVLLDATEEDYEKIFFVKDQSTAVDAVHEMIYVDFAKDTGIRRLGPSIDRPKLPTRPEALPGPSRPPPRPPKPKAVTGTARQGVNDDDDDYEKPDSPKSLATSEAATGNSANDYIRMTKPVHPGAKSGPKNSAPVDAGDYVIPDFNLAEVNFSKSDDIPRKKTTFLNKLKGIYASSKNVKRDDDKVQSPTSPKSFEGAGDEDDDVYDEIDDYSNSKARLKKEQKNFPTSPKTGIPTAFVSPQSTHVSPDSNKPSVKSFALLTTAELNERLKKCGMTDFAEKCLNESLDGPFISSSDVKTFLGAPFNLSEFDLKKLERIKENWVPL